MASPSAYFIRIGGEARGPMRLDQLRDLAIGNAITPETEIAADASGPWAPIAMLEIFVEVFPAKREVGFKPPEFEELNRGEAPPVDANEIIATANQPLDAFRGREFVVTPGAGRAAKPGDPPNEVQVIVQEVGRKISEHAPPVIMPPAPPPFPRWKWFAIPSVIGSAGILCIPMLYENGYDEMSTSIVIGWTVLFNALLVGVMVLDQRHNRPSVAKETKPDVTH